HCAETSDFRLQPPDGPPPTTLTQEIHHPLRSCPFSRNRALRIHHLCTEKCIHCAYFGTSTVPRPAPNNRVVTPGNHHPVSGRVRRDLDRHPFLRPSPGTPLLAPRPRGQCPA